MHADSTFGLLDEDSLMILLENASLVCQLSLSRLDSTCRFFNAMQSKHSAAEGGESTDYHTCTSILSVTERGALSMISNYFNKDIAIAIKKKDESWKSVLNFLQASSMYVVSPNDL